MLAPYGNRNPRRYINPYIPAVPVAAVAGQGLYNVAKSMYNKYTYAKSAKQAAEVAKQMYRGYKKVKKVKKEFKKQVKKNKPINKLKNQVKELKRLANSNMGVLTYRVRNSVDLQVAVNAQASADYGYSSITSIETALAQLRYYNPSSPGTLVTADGTTGTYQKEFLITRQFGHIWVHNNYQVPVNVAIYSCRPKVDTSILPTTAWNNGLTDSSNVDNTNPLIYPTDSLQFSDLWKIEATKKVLLKPGRSIDCIMSDKNITYDPSFVDSHADTYQTHYKSGVFMVVISGVLGHDTVADQQGHLPAGVDIEVTQVFEIKYDAGAEVKYTYCVDNQDTFTNGGVISSYPVADNIGYSLS